MYFAYFVLFRGDGVSEKVIDTITEETRIEIIRQLNESGKAHCEYKGEY